MAEIQYLPKTKLTNGQLTTMATTVQAKLNEINLSLLEFKPQKEAFDQSTVDFINSQTKISEGTYTKEKSILKTSMNTLKSGFFHSVQGDLTSENPERKKAAKVVWNALTPYRNISRYIFDDMITFVQRMLNMLDEEPLKTHIKTMGYEGRLVEIQTKLNECIILKKKRFDDSGQRIRLRKTEVTRSELCITYDKLVKRLNSLAELNGDESYLELFAWWNAMINQYRREISIRLGKGAGGSADDYENSQHDPSSGGDTGGGDDDRPVIE